jgi:hypothetical protein
MLRSGNGEGVGGRIIESSATTFRILAALTLRFCVPLALPVCRWRMAADATLAKPVAHKNYKRALEQSTEILNRLLATLNRIPFGVSLDDHKPLVVFFL